MLAFWLACLSTAMPAQSAPTSASQSITVVGQVTTPSGQPIPGAIVKLSKNDSTLVAQTLTDPAGNFAFPAIATGAYSLGAEKSGLGSVLKLVQVSGQDRQDRIVLILPNAVNDAQAMEFSDNPTFVVAGVTDWTAVGGHGSDAILRTSEGLATEILTLKPDKPPSSKITGDENDSAELETKLKTAVVSFPASFAANRALGVFYLQSGKPKMAVPALSDAFEIDPDNRDNEYDLTVACKGSGDTKAARQHLNKLLSLEPSAKLYRLKGELDETANDPLAAVHAFEQAVHLESSEQNYFEWGSELLLHRAVWQAEQVFKKGTETFPKSARMLAALGASLFAEARYEDAAMRLCAASDMNPADTQPYILLSKVDQSSPSALPCVEDKLARFAGLDPDNSQANYSYAMAILKTQGQPPSPAVLEHVEVLLTKAITLDKKCAEGYFQLGVLSANRGNYAKAVGFYTKAIEASPQLADAYYRLGVAYDRMGQLTKAKEQFLLHDAVVEQQSQQTELQRRELKQFLVVLQDQTKGR